MLIDWFTVAAQAANFLILVWLLKRFLYRPVLAAIATREKLIADQLQDAAAKKIEAQAEQADFKRKNDEFDRQRTAMLGQAVESVKTERQKMLDAARSDAEALRTKLQDSVRSDRENLNRAIVDRARQEVFAITRKALADLSSTSLETSLGEMFVRRLRALAGPMKHNLIDALQTSSAPACVRSSFDLSPDQKNAIQSFLDEMSPPGIPIQFEVAPGLICGIELIANGQKIAWNITDYLASLEKQVGEMLDSKTEPIESPQ